MKGGERPRRETFQVRADNGGGDASGRRDGDHYWGFMFKTEVGRKKTAGEGEG